MRMPAILSFFVALLFAVPTLAAEQSIIVFDASGSMWAKIGNKTKIEIARETLGTVLKSVPKSTSLGLMVYGHRDKGSCSDIELAIPPAVGTEAAITKFVNGINPKGKTPLTEAVRQAAETLKYTEDKATVILLTDGLETCEADPCALATELEQKGVDFTAHVVGFGLTADEGKKVACLAENTGGKYFQASDAAQLADALKQTVAATPAPAPSPPPSAPEKKPDNNVMTDALMAEGGPSLSDSTDVYWQIFKAGANGEPDGDHVDSQYRGAFATNVPPGQYIGLVTLNGWMEQKIPFEVKENEVAKPVAIFNAGHVILTPKREANGPAMGTEAALEVKSGDYSTTYYGPSKFYMPAGTFTVNASAGTASSQQEIAIKAGEELAKDIVIASGVITSKAVYGDQGPDVEGGNIFFQVLSTKADINGDRKSFGYSYGVDTKLDIPAGDYILSGQLGTATAEMPFSIAGGEGKVVTVNLNAGVLAIKAPGADKISVLSGKKDIQGNQKELSYAFAEEHTDTLHPGDYIVHVTYKGDQAPKDMPASVKVGERAEVNVE